MPTFTVATNDVLWQPVVNLYMELTKHVPTRKTPDNEMVVQFSVRALGEAGKAIPGFPGSAKQCMVIDLVADHPVHAAALAYAAETGGFSNLGRAGIKVIGITLNNNPPVVAVS